MNIAVIYKSHYGTTKKYAEWIAQALHAELFDQKTVGPKDLLRYDIVIYGGGLYAGGILGVDLVTKNPCKKLVLFTVGLAKPSTTDYSEILDKNLSPSLRNSTKIFHLRGGIDYAEIGPVHRAMMAMLKKITIGNQPYEQLSDEDKAFVDTYGKKVDFTNQEAIAPLIDYVNQQTQNTDG